MWQGFGGQHARRHLHLLVRDEAAIEFESGTELGWPDLPGKKESQVVLRRSADPTRREDWPEQHAWLRDSLEAFHRVFGPRIKGLNAGGGDPEPTSP